MKVYIVSDPSWEGGFDSVWSTEDLAHARADELDPYPDKDGVKWGIIVCVNVDSDPEDDNYTEFIDRRA